MNRLDYYFRQKVSESELDLGFTYCENADFAMMVDTARVGVMSGLAVAQQTIPNLTVLVALGIAYDKLGERLSVPSPQTVDVSQDYLAISTAVTTPGNEKYVSVFLVFNRNLSDPRTDGNGFTVYFQRAETFSFKVVQGTEAAIGTATRPALDATNILLADVHLIQGQTSVVTGDITTSRREDSIVASGSPQSLRRGYMKDAFADLLGFYNNHVTGAADRHHAADVDYAGGAAWADGTTNPAATVEAQLDKIINDLATGSGAAKIHANVSGNFIAGTVRSQLDQLGAIITHRYIAGHFFYHSDLSFAYGATIDDFTAPAGSYAESTNVKLSLSSQVNDGDRLLIDADIVLETASANRIDAAIFANHVLQADSIRSVAGGNALSGHTKLQLHLRCSVQVSSPPNPYPIAIAVLPQGADDGLLLSPSRLEVTILRVL